MKKSSVQIKPKRASLDDFILTKSGVEATKKDKGKITTWGLFYELVALQRRAKALHLCPILASKFKAIDGIVAHDSPNTNAPVEKAAQDHGVTVGGSGIVGIKNAVVIGPNVAGSDKSGGKL